MERNPIFIPSLFSKVMACTLVLAAAIILAVALISGSITALDLAGTLICAVIIAYIVHLWIFHWRGSAKKDEQ